MQLAVVGRQLTVLCVVLRLRISNKKSGLLETVQLYILAMKSRTLGKWEEREKPERKTGRCRGSPLIICGAGKFGVIPA